MKGLLSEAWRQEYTCRKYVFCGAEISSCKLQWIIWQCENLNLRNCYAAAKALLCDGVLTKTNRIGIIILPWICVLFGARGSAAGWGTALQGGRLRVRFPMVSLDKTEFCWSYVFVTTEYSNGGRNSTAGIATRYGLNGSVFEPRQGAKFPHPSRPSLGPTQPLYYGYLGSFPGAKRLGRGVDHPPYLQPTCPLPYLYDTL